MGGSFQLSVFSFQAEDVLWRGMSLRVMNWGSANSSQTPFFHREEGDESGGVSIHQANGVSFQFSVFRSVLNTVD